MSMEI